MSNEMTTPDSGNNQEGSGTPNKLPVVSSGRDLRIIELKLQGRKNSEIAKEMGMRIKTVHNILSKGGRLEKVYEAYLVQRQAGAQEQHYRKP